MLVILGDWLLQRLHGARQQGGGASSVWDTVSKFFVESDDCADLDQLTRAFLSTVEKLGFSGLSYRHLLWQFSQTPSADAQRLDTLSADWAGICAEKKYLDGDPILDDALRRRFPFRLSDLALEADCSDRRREFAKDLARCGYLDVIFVPVITRPGDLAMFWFASSATIVEPCEQMLETMQTHCQSFHTAYNRLALLTPDIKLSRREAEVLSCIAKGLGNHEIANALGVSANTVDSLIRRCFAKLNASSRVGAVLTAMSLGLIPL